MAIRIGNVVEGSPYTMKFQAAGNNDGVSFVLVGWVPGEGAQPRSWILRVEAGQAGTHQETAPAAASFFFIEFEVDVPDTRGAGTLTITGAIGGTKVIPVTGDETYRLLVVGR